MDRRVLEQFLLDAETRVEHGRQRVGGQRQLVAELQRDGRDSTPARRQLDLFEETQKAHEADRERLKRQIACLDRISN